MEPISFFGEMLDGNSLGKWIYDCTLKHYEASSPTGNTAAELWLLLIPLTEKTEGATLNIRRIESRGLKRTVHTSIARGEKLIWRLQEILKGCETAFSARTRHDESFLSTDIVDWLFGKCRTLQIDQGLMRDINQVVMYLDEK